jgi:hypothetical protein
LRARARAHVDVVPLHELGRHPHHLALDAKNKPGQFGIVSIVSQSIELSDGHRLAGMKALNAAGQLRSWDDQMICKPS